MKFFCQLTLSLGSLFAVGSGQRVRVGEVLGFLVDALGWSLEFLLGFVVVITAETTGLALILASDHHLRVFAVVQDLEIFAVGFNDGNWVNCVGDSLAQVDADIVLGS